MELSPAILNAVRTATAENISDIEKQKSSAIAAVRGLVNFCDLSDALIDFAIQNLVYEARGLISDTVARMSRNPNPPAHQKVNVYACPAFQKVAHNVFNLMMGGKRLGDLTGKDLDRIAEQERDIAAGHIINSELAVWARSKGVRDDQRVEDVLSSKAVERKLRDLEKAHRSPPRAKD